MWSPRQLAELAGTSRRAVRHYDEIGLLPAPDRQSNGYGRYGVEHLIRLLRIRRLSTLGLTLPQIASLGGADRVPAAMVQDLDADLADRIEELRRTRAELASMLQHPGPVDLPADLTGQVRELPAVERALVVVLSRVLDVPRLESYVRLMTPYRDHAAVTTFDDLPADADPAQRVELAASMAGHVRRFESSHAAEVVDIDRYLRLGVPSRQRTVDEAVRELYNPAQREVLHRVRVLQPRLRRLEPVGG